MEEKNYRKCLGKPEQYNPRGSICKNCMWIDICRDRVLEEEIRREKIRELANEISKTEKELKGDYE